MGDPIVTAIVLGVAISGAGLLFFWGYVKQPSKIEDRQYLHRDNSRSLLPWAIGVAALQAVRLVLSLRG